MKSFLELKNKLIEDGIPEEEFIARCTEPEITPSLEETIANYNQMLRCEIHDLPIIFVGIDTSGLASGADIIFKLIEEEIQKKDLKVILKKNGGLGFGAIEPVVEIKHPGEDRIIYRNIHRKEISDFIEKTIIQKEIYTKKLFATHGNSTNKIQNINETQFFKNQKRIVLRNCGIINPVSIDEYISSGGFRSLDKVLRRMSPTNVIDEVVKSGLRGRGGGGFLTGKKWELANAQSESEKFIICNADEGDPGAFMDRSILEGDPFQLIEGMLIAAYAIGANYGYIYCRAEYPLAIQRLEISIKLCKEYGLLGDNILNSGYGFNLKIKKGAGAFVCGEETALINSIEGKRGMPRPRPPFPTTAGLWGKPTVINNVETLANIATIIQRGSHWFSSIGTENSKGTKVFALSGKITNSGLVEVPMGVTLRDIVFSVGGGIPDDKKFKAVQIGGPSGGCLPESVIDTQVDYESLKSIGAMMGSGGFVVMDEDTCMVDVAKFFISFIQSESCGKCVPCREGTKRMLEIIERIGQDYRNIKEPIEELYRFKGIIHLKRLSEVIKDTSLCGLGQSAPNPVLSSLHYFKEEWEEHIYERNCPAHVCKELLTFTIDSNVCSGCGLCIRKCSAGAILGEKKQPHYILEGKCIKCGMCVDSCRFDAIIVN